MILPFLREEKDVKKVFLIDFLLCFAGFLVVPIIPIYMKDVLKYSLGQVGFILGIPSVICCFLGGLAYYCYRKLGIYHSVLLSLTLDILVYVVLLVKFPYIYIITFYILKGISTSIFMPILKNLYILTLKNEENTKIVFKFRYIIVCLSAIISPYFSRILYPISHKIIFYVFFSLYFTGILLLIGFKNYIQTLDLEKEKIKVLLILKEKRRIIIFLVACIIILMVFSQFEGTFILTLPSNEALEIFTLLLILNSVFGVIIQLINLKYFNKLSAYSSLILGCCSFAIAYIIFFLSNFNIIILILAIIIFTIGETLIMPNIEIFITEISNENDRVFLYGISEFKRLGFFLGPFISGCLIQSYSGKKMFIVFSCLSLFACGLFIIFEKINNKYIT